MPGPSITIGKKKARAAVAPVESNDTAPSPAGTEGTVVEEASAPVSPRGAIANVTEKATGEPFVAARLFPGDAGYVKDSLSGPDTGYAVKHKYTGVGWAPVSDGDFYRKYTPADHESASNLKLALSDSPKE